MRYSPIALTLLASGLALAAVPGTAAAQQDRSFDSHNPGRCVVASRIIDGINRHDRRDTTRFTPERDTLFSATTADLESCSSAFGGEAEDPRELLNLARLQLLTAQDQAAIASVRKHMGAMASRSPEERAWELYLVVTDYMDGKPARREAAREALAELESLGSAAASVRTLAHYSMLSDAFSRHDDETLRSEFNEVLRAWNELDEETKLWRATVLANAFTTRASVEAVVNGGDAARAVIDSALGIVPRAAELARRSVENAQRLYQNIDKPAARLEAEFWYNTGSTGTTRPAPGRVSIVLPIFRPCTGGCLTMLEGVQRILKEHGEDELDVTFRTRTYGFYLDTAPATPFAEAQYDSTYLLHEVGLPGALAIAETKYSWKADGRRVNEPTSDDLNFPGASVLLIDRKGIIRYASSGWSSTLEGRISRLIGELLAETSD